MDHSSKPPQLVSTGALEACTQTTLGANKLDLPRSDLTQGLHPQYLFGLSWAPGLHPLTSTSPEVL